MCSSSVIVLVVSAVKLQAATKPNAHKMGTFAFSDTKGGEACPTRFSRRSVLGEAFLA